MIPLPASNSDEEKNFVALSPQLYLRELSRSVVPSRVANPGDFHVPIGFPLAVHRELYVYILQSLGESLDAHACRPNRVKFSWIWRETAGGC